MPKPKQKTVAQDSTLVAQDSSEDEEIVAANAYSKLLKLVGGSRRARADRSHTQKRRKLNSSDYTHQTAKEGPEIAPASSVKVADLPMP